ncbi:MAG: mechanosensitive ion channel, partial [bacterium]|nr:mechanosensitive ion channel [bacterium]
GFALSVIAAILVYIIGAKVVKLICKLVRKMLQKHNADEGVVQFLSSIVKCLGYFIVILMILGLFGVTTASVVAVLGSAGLTLGLAVQGSLANFAGGVIILLLKPFVVGDYIIEDSNKNEGVVQEISVFYTTILTVDHRTIVVPNGTLANNSIVNLTKAKKRRVDLFVGISYDDAIAQAKQVMERLIKEEARRLPDEPYRVMVADLENSSVKMGMQLWVSCEDYWQTYWDMTEKIKLAFDEAGISIAFDQIDVHLR